VLECDTENNPEVLVIAYYFPPMGLSGVQRTLKFVKYLPDFGWNPVVLTTDSPSYYAFDDTLLSELPEDIAVYRAPESGKKSKIKPVAKKFPNYFIQKTGRYFLQIFKQPDTKIHWKKYALKSAEEIIKDHDIRIIFSTAPPFTDFLIGKELSEKYDIPLVVDYRDTWVDNPFHFFPTIWHKNYNINLEKSILTFAERAFVTTRHAKELLLKRYRFLSHDDVVIIPHGYDAEDFEAAASGNDTDPSSGKFVLTHSGLFQDDRTPRYFLKGLNQFLKKNPSARQDIELRFVGLMRNSHTKLIKKYKLDDICTLTGYLNHRDAVRQLIDSDVLWMTVNDTVRTPGKLYEYIGAEKPIFYIGPQGQMASIVNDTKAGFTAGSKDVKKIAKIFAEMYDLWKSGSLPVPDKQNAAAYNRRNLTSSLARNLSLHSKM
jgi:glycosyltransferase involved in cell wall biosynthesis